MRHHKADCATTAPPETHRTPEAVTNDLHHRKGGLCDAFMHHP